MTPKKRWKKRFEEFKDSLNQLAQGVIDFFPESKRSSVDEPVQEVKRTRLVAN